MSALPGIRVLDLSRVFAGPWAGQLLADLGADVVKVEHPRGGDDARRMGALMRDSAGAVVGDTSAHMAVNRGKRSVAADIATPAGQAVVQALAAGADVLVESFGPGVLAQYGLDHASLSATNPRLVYCSVTGFGQTGPLADRPSCNPVIQAMSGLAAITGPAQGPPALVGYSAPDINAGLYAAVAILAALHHRDRVSGLGQHIDISMLDAQIAAQSHVAMHWMVSGRRPARTAAAPAGLAWQPFGTAEGTLMLAVGDDAQFTALCRALGLPLVPDDPRYATGLARLQNADTLQPMVARALLADTAAAWSKRLGTLGVACGPFDDLATMAEDPQVVHRGMLGWMEGPGRASVPYVANPIHFSRTPIAYRRAAPPLGQDTEEVLRDWLGIEPE